MGKAKKNKGKTKKKVGPGRFDGPGDLRAVRHHVEQWKKHGVQEAENMLRMLGRDASFLVCEIAEERNDPELLEFGRRLVAVRPQFSTNLDELRRASVRAHVERAQKTAPPAVEVDDLVARGGAFALFDPIRVLESLATGGRPRKEAERLEQGDIAWFGLPRAAPTPLVLTTQPAPAEALRLRLRVDSGIIFVGAPEASDGPRLGTVRRDPNRTTLDEHLERGRFLRMKPGVYLIDAHLMPEGVRVHIQPDPDPEATLGLDPKRLSLSDSVDGGGTQS